MSSREGRPVSPTLSTASSVSRRRRPASPTASVISTMSRFDEATVEECLEYVSAPHRSWDSAVREMARVETKKQRQMSDTCSNVSAVSCYSLRSNMSQASTASAASRRGHMARLPSRDSAPPQPPPAFDVSGTTIGGSSFLFQHPRRSASNQREHESSALSGSVAGTPAGRSGVRHLPSSAPVEKGRRQQGTPNASFELIGVRPDGQNLVGQKFVPKLPPRKK